MSLDHVRGTYVVLDDFPISRAEEIKSARDYGVRSQECCIVTMERGMLFSEKRREKYSSVAFTLDIKVEWFVYKKKEKSSENTNFSIIELVCRNKQFHSINESNFRGYFLI